jgi:hypothetical protein
MQPNGEGATSFAVQNPNNNAKETLQHYKKELLHTLGLHCPVTSEIATWLESEHSETFGEWKVNSYC